MLNYIWVAISFTIVYCAIATINFYQAQSIAPTFKSLVLYNLCILPITFLANLLCTYTFNKGSRSIGQMLPVTIIYLGVGVFSFIIINFIFFKEIPRLNHLIASVMVLAALVICNWK